MQKQFHDNLLTMTDGGERLLAAVSGGVDSMVMLDLLIQTIGNKRIEVAHCNFRLRPDEADRETQLVEKVCLQKGVKCHVEYFNTKDFCAVHRLSTQEGARKLRYDFFNKLLQENMLNKIVIAHNQNDTVETFFINLLRGSGLRGLRGISAVSQNIIRPLMFASRAEIEEYAVANGVEWLVDSSNNSNDYMRNSLRHEVLPLMEKYRAGFGQMMLGNMERLKAHYDFEQQMIEKLRSEIFEGERLNIKKFIASGIQSEFLLFSLVERYGFSWEVSSDIFRSLNNEAGQGKIFHSTHSRALIDRNFLVIDSPPQIVKPEHITNDDSRIQLINKADIQNFKSDGCVAFIDAAKIQFPLVLRPWSEGDKFTPFGMKGSTKKISDLLNDLKINRFDKERIRVLESGDKIVWVVGLRTDDRFSVDTDTELVIRIEL